MCKIGLKNKEEENGSGQEKWQAEATKDGPTKLPNGIQKKSKFEVGLRHVGRTKSTPTCAQSQEVSTEAVIGSVSQLTGKDVKATKTNSYSV